MTDLDKARQAINEIDREMAELFEKRMDAVKLIAEHKKQNNMPIEDKRREDALIKNNCSYIKNDTYLPYYKRFIGETIDISKSFQQLFLMLINKTE